MSDVGRFVSMVVPDVLEAGAKMYSRSGDPDAAPKPPATGVRKPRQPNQQPAFGKQESFVDVTNPKPEDVQASLDATLAKFVDDQPTSIKRAETLIKIGQYQVELTKYAPMLVDADPETALETLNEWFSYGDADLKKSLFNSMSGAEDLVMLKSAPVEGAEHELARMLDAMTDNAGRMAMLQKMQVYGSQLHEMTARGELLKIDPEVIEAAVVEWIDDGEDGTHRELKKALADVDREARRQAMSSVGENELSDQKAGNAAAHVSSKLSGQNDRTYGSRSTGEGAGPNLRGALPARGTANGGEVTESSGPDDTGEGGVTPSVIIRRKGSTGGLGTVTPEEQIGTTDETNDDVQGGEMDAKTGKKRKKAMDKGGDLAVELVKIAPQAMIEALSGLDEGDQLEVCQQAAQDAADLMAWSMQTGETLQKSELDGAVADWLRADPDTVVLKKWVAEALASAEEIPLALGKAIMGWQEPTTARIRVRQPYATTA